MPRRKSLILFTMMVAIVALLLAASKAGAFSVEAVPCNGNGELKFPCYHEEDDTTEFRYQITANKKVEDFDLLVATDCPQGEDRPVIVDSTPGGMLYTDGKGSKKKFGRGLSSNNVYSVRYNKKNGTVSLFVEGNHPYTSINDLALVMSSDVRKWARMQVLLPACGAPDRAQTGAVTTAKCVEIKVPVPGEAEAQWLVSYNVQKDSQGCDVDDITQVEFFASEDCVADKLEETLRIPPPDEEDGDGSSYCGSLEPKCPECVEVRLSCKNYYCVEYRTNSLAKVQQCIKTLGGESCDWVEDGCAFVFEETEENPCDG